MRRVKHSKRAKHKKVSTPHRTKNPAKKLLGRDCHLYGFGTIIGWE